MGIGILYDPDFKDHVCEYYHPERPERLDACVEGLKRSRIWDSAQTIELRHASRDELSRVHDPNYVDAVLEALESSGGNLDGDTFFSSGSRNAALGAAGGGVDLAAAVHRRDVDWGWALVRPPGHHASWKRSGGFCIFNNIAVAATSLLADTDAQRVAIFDWDVHHGNGTQDQFWDNPHVLFSSMHQWPHYPGSGLSDQTGGNKAPGGVINFPLPSGSSDGEYLSAIEDVVTPIFKVFNPDHILISAGFDAHERDPLSGLEMSSECFGEMAARMKKIADLCCDGRITLFLEGGYDLIGLSESVEQVVKGISKSGTTEAPEVSSAGAQVIESTRSNIAPHWPDIF